MQTATRVEALQTRAWVKDHALSPDRIRGVLNRIPVEDRDAWLDLVLDVAQVDEDGPELPRGCVPYLPCAVSTILNVVSDGKVTETDVFVDVGSGVGRSLLLVHLLTGAGTIGIEVQPELIRSAKACAAGLGLRGARFVEGDAAEQVGSLMAGTVFFLYCPFSGERLQRVLAGLLDIARARAIRVCCVDMAPLNCSWLTRLPSSSPELDVLIK